MKIAIIFLMCVTSTAFATSPLLGNIRSKRCDACEDKEEEKVQLKNCDDVYNNGMRESGVYEIDLHGKKVKVYCEMKEDGNYKWLVVQRRVGGDLNFNRTFEEYEDGFGDLEGEFWWGLKHLHNITTWGKPYILRIDAEDQSGAKVFGVYRGFKLEGPDTRYTLRLNTSTAGNSSQTFLNDNNGRPFGTPDNTESSDEKDCADFYGGGWWYALIPTRGSTICTYTQMNARDGARNIWSPIGFTTRVDQTSMKIRPYY